MSSFGKLATIKTSVDFEKEVMVTAQQLQNSYYGKPRYRLQVWAIHQDGKMNLWCPKVKGYRLNKEDGYNIESHNIQMDMEYFIKAFEKSVIHE